MWETRNDLLSFGDGNIQQEIWKQHLRPRAVVGYGAYIFIPSPPNYVTRSPGFDTSAVVYQLSYEATQLGGDQLKCHLNFQVSMRAKNVQITAMIISPFQHNLSYITANEAILTL